MSERLFYALLCASGGTACAVAAVLAGGWAWLAAWPAVGLWLVALGYLRLGPRVFGKRPDGTLAPLHMVVLLPYLLGNWGVWHLVRRARNEAASQELADGIHVGRRPLTPAELPPGTRTVADLTCEFPERRSVRERVAYLGLPILDGVATGAPELDAFLTELVDRPWPLYLHCAAGHGRVGAVAASLLLKMGLASGADDAIEQVRRVRPVVDPGRAQRRLVEAMAERYRAREPALR